MLYELLFEPLSSVFGALRVFGYITVRTTMATFTALLIGLSVGPWLIRQLHAAQIRQYIRVEGPQSHQWKAGTPTMGGLLIGLATIVPTLLWADLGNPYVGIALAAFVGFGLVGFWDDYTKFAKKQNLGLSAKRKLGCQVVVTVFIGLVLIALSSRGDYSTELSLPFAKNVRPELVVQSLLGSPVAIPFAYVGFFGWLFFVLAGTANGVNLTDGLDGLAIGLTVVCAGALAILAYVAGHAEISAYLDVPSVPLAAELTIFCGAIVGASLAFLWYNAHPAEIFMGDVGSLSLGGGLATVAVLAKQEVVLLLIGAVFVVETVSVILQVGSFKLTGKRIFSMAPIHHHFEQLGWPESKIITRLWIVGLIMALMALSTLKLR